MDSQSQVSPPPVSPPASKRNSPFTIFLRLLILVGLVAIWAWGRWSPSSPWRARSSEWAPLVLAEAPLPTGLPLKGTEGKDSYGYPTQFVDQPAFRTLLHRRRFDELESYFEQLQAAFEADPRKEYWVNDAADAFGSAEPALEAELDAWVLAKPQSAAAPLARGTYLVTVGSERRGAGWASQTSDKQFQGMAEAFQRAAADLNRALERRPRLIAALRQLIILQRGSGGHATRATSVRAEAACPSCFQVRVAAIYSETPRWGGSYAEMQNFASRAPVADNPKLKFLAGYLDIDRATTALQSRRFDEALAAVERACALGDHWDFLDTRAEIHRARKDLPRALADHDRALALRPGNVRLLIERATTLNQLDRPEEAAHDLLAALHVEESSEDSWLNDSVAANLQLVGWKLHKEGKREEALRLYDLAVELAPFDWQASGSRATVILGGMDTGPEGLAQASAAAKAAPDDFRAQQRLDYLLAKQRDFRSVIGLWDTFLTRHPDHARAHLERAGALHHLGRDPQARADVARSCELGLAEGCARLASMGPAAP